jgi:hypothetical protein
VRILTPSQIKEYRNGEQLYAECVKGQQNGLNFGEYFKALPMMLAKHGRYCTGAHLDDLASFMPPERAREIMGVSAAAVKLSVAYFELLELTRPVARNVLFFLLLVSAFLMCLSIVWSVLVILGG